MNIKGFSFLEVIVSFLIGTLMLMFFLYFLTEISYMEERFYNEFSFLNEMNLWFFYVQNDQNFTDDILKTSSYALQFGDKIYYITFNLLQSSNNRFFFLDNVTYESEE